MSWVKANYVKALERAIRSGRQGELGKRDAITAFMNDKAIGASITDRNRELSAARHLSVKIAGSIYVSEVDASHCYRTDPESYVVL